MAQGQPRHGTGGGHLSILPGIDVYKRQAQAKATAIRTEASTRSREMKQASYEFAENILRTSQEVVAKSCLLYTSRSDFAEWVQRRLPFIAS